MKTILAALAALFVASSAHAVTIDFTDAACGGGSCGNGSPLDQTYGDITGVNVIYDGNVATPTIDPVLYWSTGYEGNNPAIYVNNGVTMSITLEAEAGYEVSLESLGLAPFEDRVSDVDVVIIDLATGLEVFEDSYEPLSTDGITTISGTGWTSDVGYQLLFGPNLYNVGITSITYSATQIAAVPLPAAGWMLLSVLGGLVALRRRRT